MKKGFEGAGYSLILIGDAVVTDVVAVDYECEEALAADEPVHVLGIEGGSYVQVYPDGEMFVRGE